MAIKEKAALDRLLIGGEVFFNEDNLKYATSLCNDLLSPKNEIIYENQERPDILIISDTNIYGIEHFEFDDFKREKGSTGKATVKKFEKDFDKDFEQANVEEGYFRKNIDLKETLLFADYDFFVKNFIESFNDHYSKINEYKKNIEEYLKINSLQREIKILFLIENSSPFSPLISKKGYEGKIYLPFNSKEILDCVNNSDNLDGLIYLSYLNNDIRFVHSFDGGKMINETFEKDAYMSNSKVFISDTIIVIPKEKIKEGET